MSFFGHVRGMICRGCTRECEHRESTDAAARCPLGHWGPFYGADVVSPPPEAFAGLQSIMREAGPRLWRELHTAAERMPLDALPAFLAVFLRRIPCGDCRAWFDHYCRENPAPFGSKEAFFRWTVEAHNAVNRKLNREQWEFKRAEKLWILSNTP